MSVSSSSSLFVPIILAGGKGERFWPLSRRDRPKQFLCLDGSGRSLLQATVDRLAPLAGGAAGVRIVAGPHLSDQIRAQLPELPAECLLVEPEGRDTGPALAWATLEVAKSLGEAAVLGFFPADHWIGDRAAFEQTIRAAARLAQAQGAIVTLGIAPTSPATGYGYIERGDSLGEFDGLGAYRVARFTEKPDRPTAESFVASGRYSWNGGMFVFTAATALGELARHAPEILEPLRREGTAAYATLPKLSIDYALMEKTDRAAVLPAAFGWDDLGDWTALERLQDPSAQAATRNVELATHVGLDTEGSIIYCAESGETIATLGLKDVVVVRAGNVTLVADKHRVQDIKTLLKQLQADPQWGDRL